MLGERVVGIVSATDITAWDAYTFGPPSDDAVQASCIAYRLWMVEHYPLVPLGAGPFPDQIVGSCLYGFGYGHVGDAYEE
jgi:hypothetical protein